MSISSNFLKIRILDNNEITDEKFDDDYDDDDYDDDEEMNLKDFLKLFSKLKKYANNFLKKNEKKILKIQSKSDKEKNHDAIIEFLKIKIKNFNSISNFINGIINFINDYLNDETFKLDKYYYSMLNYWNDLEYVIHLLQDCQLDFFSFYFPLYSSFVNSIDDNQFSYDYSKIWKLSIKILNEPCIDDLFSDDENEEEEDEEEDNIELCLISFQYTNFYQCFKFPDNNNDKTFQQEEKKTQVFKLTHHKMFSCHLPDVRIWMDSSKKKYLFKSFEFDSNDENTFQKSAICDAYEPEKITLVFDALTFILFGLYYLKFKSSDLSTQRQTEKKDYNFRDINILEINHLLIPTFIINQKILEHYQKQKQKMDADIPIEKRLDDSIIDPFVQSKKLIGIIHSVFKINYQSHDEFIECIQNNCRQYQKITQDEYPNFLKMEEKRKKNHSDQTSASTSNSSS